MIRYKLPVPSYPSTPIPSMVTDMETGQWVTLEDAQELERENALLRRELEKYKQFTVHHIQDECELELELEHLGLCFYDDYGHLGVTSVIVEYIKQLQGKLDHESENTKTKKS